jgi:mRNA-degrading endonuclease RelE of RelBE toxin-antitoxin system
VEVRLTADAMEDYAALPRVIQTRVLKVVDRLEQWPNVSGAKPLRGRWAGRFRVRAGDYRLAFSIRGETIWIERIGHRDGFYEDGL